MCDNFLFFSPCPFPGQIQTLKSNLQYATEKVDNLTEELEETRRKYLAMEEFRNLAKGEAADVEARLQEARAQVDRMEKARGELQTVIATLESEKTEAKRKIHEQESRIVTIETSELVLRKELEETKSVYLSTLDSNRMRESQASEVQRELKFLQTQHRELEMEHETYRVGWLRGSLAFLL